MQCEQLTSKCQIMACLARASHFRGCTCKEPYEIERIRIGMETQREVIAYEAFYGLTCTGGKMFLGKGRVGHRPCYQG